MPITINGGSLTLNGGHLVVAPRVAYGEGGFLSDGSNRKVASNTDLPGSNTMTVTVMLRFNSNTGASDEYPFQNFDASNGYVLYLDGPGNLAKFHYRDGTSTRSTTPGISLTTGFTYVLTGVLDYSNNVFSIASNGGAPDDVGVGTMGPLVSCTTLPATIGQRVSSSDIIGVSYAEVALTPGQVAAYQTACMAAGDVLPFEGVSSLYQAKKGITKDLIGSVDLTSVGAATSRSTFSPDFE